MRGRGSLRRGAVDTGERTFGNDYYQDIMLWSLPAAIEGQDLSGPTKPGGLVDRVVKAARRGVKSGKGLAKSGLDRVDPQPL